MADGVWNGVIGGVIAIVSSWLTAVLKQRSDAKYRLQERKFQMEDQERERKRALEEAASNEDKYWHEKRLKFNVIQSAVFRARTPNDIIKSAQELQTFLEENPEYLFDENMQFFYLYCNSEFHQRLTELKSDDPTLQTFTKALIHFKAPTGAEIRRRRNSGMRASA